MLGATVTAPKNVTFQWRSWKDACQIPIDWWDVLQPNRPGVEGCLLMANNHKFHDGSCTEKFQYICERRKLLFLYSVSSQSFMFFYQQFAYIL